MKLRITKMTILAYVQHENCSLLEQSDLFVEGNFKESRPGLRHIDVALFIALSQLRNDLRHV